MSTLRFIIFSLAVIIASGCIEHSLKLTVLPHDKILINYSMQGDRMDMEDGLEFLPDSTKWNSSRSIEEKDEETVHIFNSSVTVDSFNLLSTTLNWSKSLADSIYLIPSMNLEVKDYFFAKIYIFDGIYPSRNYSLKYGDIWDFIPPECRVLEDDDQVNSLLNHEVEILEKKYALGLIQWNRERYEHRFHKVWNTLKYRQSDLSTIPQTSFSIALAGWKDDLHQHLNSIDADNPELLNLEWWDELKPLFLGRFIDLIGIDKMNAVEEISESLDKEYRISRDLDDEQFEVKILMPGKVFQNDGIHDDVGNPMWAFTGKELMNNSFQMRAQSIEVSYQKTGSTIFVFLLLLGYLLIKRKRANNQ